MGGIAFVALLANHSVGRPTILIGNAKMPAWTPLDFLRDISLSVGLAVVCAVISHGYQIAEDRRSKSKL